MKNLLVRWLLIYHRSQWLSWLPQPSRGCCSSDKHHWPLCRPGRQPQSLPRCCAGTGQPDSLACTKCTPQSECKCWSAQWIWVVGVTVSCGVCVCVGGRGDESSYTSQYSFQLAITDSRKCREIFMWLCSDNYCESWNKIPIFPHKPLVLVTCNTPSAACRKECSTNSQALPKVYNVIQLYVSR